MKKHEIYYVNLDPTVGHEIKKTRPCIIVSPDEMNDYLKTVIIVPITSAERDIPTRVYLDKKGTGLSEHKNWAALDQIRNVDKSRLVNKIGNVSINNALEISQRLVEMFSDI